MYLNDAFRLKMLLSFLLIGNFRQKPNLPKAQCIHFNFLAKVCVIKTKLNWQKSKSKSEANH